MKQISQIKIVQMAGHFLYMPLYYCETNDFFGFLPSGVHIQIVNSPYRTDKSALDTLLKDDDDDIVFALCDPTEILGLDEKFKNKPVPIAAVVTNTAFWAINHGRYNSRSLKELARYDRIIAYSEGTTSYAIAKRIFESAEKKPNITSVSPGDGKEFIALRDSEDVALALSPDLILLTRLVQMEKEFKIDLEIGVTPEYHNVLVSALLCRESTIDKHRDLVIGVVTALQRALLMCIYEDKDLILATSQRRDASVEVAQEAIRRANDSELFPANARVRRVHWLNACRARYEAEGKDFDDESIAYAEDIFDSRIQTVSEELEPAFKAGIASYVNRSTPLHQAAWSIWLKRIWVLTALLVALGMLSVLFGMPQSILPSTLAAGLLVVAASTIEALARFFELHDKNNYYRAHILTASALVITTIAAPVIFNEHTNIIYLIISILFGIEVAIISTSKSSK